MNAQRDRSAPWFIFALLGCFLAWAGLAAQAPPSSSNKAGEKLYTWEFRSLPWPKVFEWLTDQTGMPVFSRGTPTGTLDVVAPKGAKYTLAQTIDLINEALLLQKANKYVLIRRSASFNLAPADEKIDPDLVPLVRVEDLEKYGKTEIVKLQLKLQNAVAEEVAGDVKKLMSPFGDIVLLGAFNQLVLVDNVATLRQILRNLGELPGGDVEPQADTLSYPCKFIAAKDAAAQLREFMGDAKQVIETTTKKRGDSEEKGKTSTKIRVTHITSDDRTNTVHVNASADKIGQAKAFLQKIDVGLPGQAPFAKGGPFMATYPVPGGNADAVIKVLQFRFKEDGNLRLSAIGPSQIMVWACPQDQLDIAKVINDARVAPGAVELVPLTVLDATRLAETLKGAFSDKANGLFIEADPTRNAIVIKGTQEQVKEVKQFIQAIGESPAAQLGNMRIISLDKGSAATLAEALQHLLQTLRPNNPVKINLPGRLDNLKKPDSTEPKLPPPNQNETRLRGPGVSPVAFAAQNKLVEPKDKLGDKTIHITAFGNKLVITSEDRDALNLVQELVRLYTQIQPGEGDFEVIPVLFISAVEAAYVLDEAFNGPRQANGQGGPGGGRGRGGANGGGNNQRGGGGGQFGGGGGGIPGLPFGNVFGGGGAPQATPRTERIRVVADPSTNKLLVKASPLDMLTVHSLLKKIDVGETDSLAVIKTWVIGPLKHAQATDIASILKDVFRESMNNASRAGVVNTTPFGAFAAFGRNNNSSQNVDANGTPRGVTLSVGVDDRTNSLIVACPESMYKDISVLVKRLEDAAKDTTQVVQVVRVKGIDPYMVQQAIDALQGRRSTVPPTGGNFGGGFGTGGFGGFRGTGGFQGGGFQGGGFQGGQGGFRPGGPGGNQGGGGARPGGGGPGGQRGAGARGPGFFEQRVMDDPQESVLYDPCKYTQCHFRYLLELENTLTPAGYVSADDDDDGFVQAPAAQPNTPPAVQLPGGDTTFSMPRLPAFADALPSLDLVVVRASNPADLAAALRIIEYIQKEGAGAEVQIQIVPLRWADATSLTGHLNQLFSRIIVGPNSTQITQVRPGQPGGGFPGGGFPGGQFGQGQQQPGQGQTGQQNAQAASMVLIPLPRQNAILMAAPKSRVPDVLKEIQRLDQPIRQSGQAIPYPLKRAPAQTVATIINNFYADRYGEAHPQHQIRVTFDVNSNTIFVQAAPADLAEIEALIERIDSTVSRVVNELRVIPLRNAVSDDLKLTITQAVSEGVVAPRINVNAGVGSANTGAGTGAGLGGGGLGGGGAGGGGIGGAAGGQVQLPTQNKSYSLRFIDSDGNKGAQAGILDDIRINSDPRINALIVSAPKDTMELILNLVRSLDVPPQARAEISIFHLRRADATQLALMLQQIYTGSGAAGAAAAAGPRPGGVGGGATGAFGTGFTGGGAAGTPGGAAALGGGGGGAGTGGQARPLQITLNGMPVQGAPLVDLRLSVDERTNSLIVAGSRNDLNVIEAVVAKLEDAEIPQRRNVAYRLKNSLAADVAAALNDFINKTLTVYSQGNYLPNYQEIQRNIVVTPEPITNTLLINATPQYFDEIIQMVMAIDAMPPQVVIQVLVAEVDLSGDDEFGVELGLQSPVLFQRSVIPALNNQNGATVTYTTPTSGVGLVPPGVTATTTNPVAQPGFNFNNPGLALGNNPLVGPSTVGVQSLSSLGVGRVSPTNGLGGFVFSMQSDFLSVLVRALKTQGRIDILSRPQIRTLDNQTALLNVGQNIPLLTSSNVTATGIVTTNISRVNVGVNLQVTPKIMPDGQVLMRVIPEVSAISPAQINLGNGTTGTAINVQHFESTVTAADGETVVLGGMIAKQKAMNENKIPWFGDLPHVGWMFRFRSMQTSSTELLVILTPHVVRCREDGERILAEESRRVDWMLGNVLKVHGTVGMEPVTQPMPPGPTIAAPQPWGPLSPLTPTPFMPPGEPLPRPRVLPPASQNSAPPAIVPTTNSGPSMPVMLPNNPPPVPLP